MNSRYRSRRGQDIVRQWCKRRLEGWSIAHERHELTTAAGHTHLVVAGSGGATVLYLPGTNFNAATSLRLASELVPSARVVLADLPGQPGLSTGERPRRQRVLAHGAWAGEVVDWVKTSISTAPLVLVGHSLGAAVALATPTAAVAALVVINPAGLVRLRVSPAVLRSTLPWLLCPTQQRSRALLEQMTAPARTADPALVEWMALVARHTKPSGAPGPLSSTVTARWSATPKVAVSGEHDCFLPPARLGPAVRDRLDVELTMLRGLGHLSVEDNPAGLAAAITAALPATGNQQP